MSGLAGFFLGFAVCAATNIITALFSRRAAVKLLPWLMLYILIHGSFVVVNSDDASRISMNIARRFPSWPSYVLVMAIGAALSALYWRGVQLAAVALDKVTTVTTHPVQPPIATPTDVPSPAYSVADIKVVCDDTSARIEVTNRGALALFSATLSIQGEVKPPRTAGLHCRWEGSNSEEINIAKGQMRRLIVADRRHYAPTTFPDKGITFVHHGTWWEMHALADGAPVLVEGQSGPHASDIILTIEVIANPDFKDGVKRTRITLTPSKAVARLGSAASFIRTAAPIYGVLHIGQPSGAAPLPAQSLPLIPHITALTPVARQAYRDDGGIVHLGRGPVETGMQTMRYAILAPFKNTAKAGVQTRHAKDVSASVIFQDASGSPITGAWIESATHAVDMPMGGPEQCLILAFAEQGTGAFMISDERSGLARRMMPISFCPYPKDGKPFHRDFAMLAEVMESGHLVLKAKYNVRITLPYPQVSLVSASYPTAQPEQEAQGRSIAIAAPEPSAHLDRKANDLRMKALELRLEHAQLEKGAQALRHVLEDAERRNLTQPRPELVVGHDRMRGFDHSLVTAPGLNDPRWNMRPFYIRNDGKATALNITVDGEMVGSRSISFGLESTSVKEGGEISLSIYRNHDRIDTHIESVFTKLIEQKIKSGATERIEERLSVRVKYKDRLLSEYSDRYDIIVAAHPKDGNGWQMEPMRVDLVLEES